MKPPDAGVRAAAIAAALVAHRDRTGRIATPVNGRASGDGAAPSPSHAVAATDAWKQAARREAIGDR
jgi:hypothetical protein